MTRGNATKPRLLGMPYATACNQLRKKILFSVLCGRVLSRDCFRCGQPIESVEELSVEHKVPWQSAADPVASFFDLDNIAFSHLRCNSWAPNGGKRTVRTGIPSSSKTSIVDRVAGERVESAIVRSGDVGAGILLGERNVKRDVGRVTCSPFRSAVF